MHFFLSLKQVNQCFKRSDIIAHAFGFNTLCTLKLRSQYRANSWPKILNIRNLSQNVECKIFSRPFLGKAGDNKNQLFQYITRRKI